MIFAKLRQAAWNLNLKFDFDTVIEHKGKLFKGLYLSGEI